MADRLTGKVAIVSAAAGAGMGQAVAQRFAEEGAEVVVTDAHEKRVAETAEKLSDECGRKVLGFRVDVRNSHEIGAAVQGTLDRSKPSVCGGPNEIRRSMIAGAALES